MRTNLYIIIVVVFSLFSLESYAGGAPCSPSTGNGSCATATSLTSGAACVNGTSCSGSAESGGSCLFAGSQCSWYSFVATSTDMFVNITILTTNGCNISSNVFSSGGSCGTLGAEISCLAGAPLDDFHSLTGLTIGNTYFVQVCYPLGGPCGNNGKATWCVNVGDVPPPCNTCALPCGTAEGYATPPTIATVVADCTNPPFPAPLQPGSTNTFCFDLTAASTSIDFNVIITSNCGGGNVTNFSWALYNNPACGGPIQTGTLASLTFSPVVIGNSYVFCYTFDVPAGCTHSQHCPYFVGAAPLPISLTNFTAEPIDNQFIQLDWITVSEINNDYFTIEKSKDGEVFEVVGIVDGAGNSSMVNNYTLEDKKPYTGTSYYRLKQTDYDNNFSYSDLVAVKIKSIYDGLTVYPNPVEGLSYVSFSSSINTNTTITVYDISGRKVLSKTYFINEGNNNLMMKTEELTQGMYFLQLGNGEEYTTVKFIKN